MVSRALSDAVLALVSLWQAFKSFLSLMDIPRHDSLQSWTDTGLVFAHMKVALFWVDLIRAGRVEGTEVESVRRDCIELPGFFVGIFT
jgi:hypothetical protein